MIAIFVTSGGLIPAKILSAWLSAGNSVAELWIGSKDRRRFLAKDRTLGIAAPSWSIAALVQRYGIPVRRHPNLSTWNRAADEIQRLEADVLITAVTGQIVPENILTHFNGRAVNFHSSVLPRYRGRNPRAGMVLDGNGHLYGGMTLHRLARGIDEGDIIGIRAAPYDPHRGHTDWLVRLARAAESLTQNALQNYLNGSNTATPQPIEGGSYRRLQPDELRLSSTTSTARTQWLCDEFGDTEWLRFRAPDGRKYVVSRFVRRIGSRTLQAPRIGKRTIEYDAADGRVRVARPHRWTPLLQTMKSWLAIARTQLTSSTIRSN